MHHRLYPWGAKSGMGLRQVQVSVLMGEGGISLRTRQQKPLPLGGNWGTERVRKLLRVTKEDAESEPSHLHSPEQCLQTNWSGILS